MPTTVTTRGQVTIPRPIRERLVITPGSAVDFQLARDGQIVLVKVDGQPPTSRYAALGAALAPG